MIAASSLALGGGGLAGCGPLIRQRADADVLILGAGLSGLHAARLLAAEGVRVLVLEGQTRIGGRMWTRDDLPGRPEAGGQQVGQTYARIRATAAELGLAIVPPSPTGGEGAGKTLVLGDRRMDARDWASDAANPFPEAFRAFTPDLALIMAAARTNPFDDPYDWPDAREAQDISAADFLAARGFTREARALCDIALNANSLDTYSMANLWRTLVLFAQERALGRSGEIEGGSQRLPEAMAASLEEGSVRAGRTIRAIRADESGVAVTCDGEEYRAAYAISTLPFPALRRLALDAPLTPLHRAAIGGLPYTRIHQVTMVPQDRYWERDGLAAEIWSDGPLERVFPIRDSDGNIVALKAWINGTGVDTARSDADFFALAEREMRRLRGAEIRALDVVRWDETTPMAGGA